MRIILATLVSLGLSGCVGSDGSPALGASDSQQVFSFTMNGAGSRGGHCTAQGAAGRVSSGTNLLGAPTVTIRGNVRQGTIICRDAAGATYITAVNQVAPRGMRTPSANAILRPGRSAHDVTLDMGSGITRVFGGALVQVR